MKCEPMPTDPTIFAALVSAVVAFVVALITSGISAWVAVSLQKDRLRTELKLEFAAEAAIRELLSDDRWPKRSFEAIQKRLQGFKPDELRRHLIRSGAVSFQGKSGEELWGLPERNKDEEE